MIDDDDKIKEKLIDDEEKEEEEVNQEEEDEMADFIDDDDGTDDTESIDTVDVDMKSDTTDVNDEDESEEEEEAEIQTKKVAVKANKKKVHDADAPPAKKAVKRYAEPDQILSKIDMINLTLSKQKQIFSADNQWEIVKPIATASLDYDRWQEQHGNREAYFFADDGVSE